MLIRDGDGRVLLVNPSYKPDWDMPGGMCEANESPSDAARREIREELGLEIRLRALLCVDWVPPHGPWDDALMFIFDGRVLDDAQIAGIKLADGELTSFEFCTRTQAEERLRPYVYARLSAAISGLTSNQATYLQDGQAPGDSNVPR